MKIYVVLGVCAGERCCPWVFGSYLSLAETDDAIRKYLEKRNGEVLAVDEQDDPDDVTVREYLYREREPFVSSGRFEVVETELRVPSERAPL
jgi:hypothetical protein